MEEEKTHLSRETLAGRQGGAFGRVAGSARLLYRRVLREEMGTEATTFLRNLSLVTVGSAVAALLTFAFGVLGGRILGPEEYGHFALIQSTADFMQLPMMLGFSAAMVRYLSETDDEARQTRIVATAYTLVILYTAVFAGAFLLFRAQLGDLLSMTSRGVVLAVVIAVTQVIYTIVASTQRGLGKMRAFALLQPVYGAILMLAFGALVAGAMRSFEAMAYPQVLAYALTGVITLASVGRRHLKLALDRAMAATLTKYALFALVASLFSAIYTNIGRILIGRYMTAADVGIYSAYYSPSLNVATLIFITFNAVFFPAASKRRDKKAIFRVVDRLVPYLILAGTPLVFGFEFVILKLYGGRYPIDPVLMLIFAVAAVLVVWYGVYASTFNSEGLKGVKMTSISVTLIALVDLGLNLWLIPRFGLVGATAAIAVAFAAGVLCLRLLRKRLLA